MRAILVQIASVATIVFAVSSMLSVGLAYRISSILGLLVDARIVFRALVANFVLVPLLAVGIERLIPMDPPLALGLFLLAGAAGAPFLIKLASAARSNLALSAALLMILMTASHGCGHKKPSRPTARSSSTSLRAQRTVLTNLHSHGGDATGVDSTWAGTGTGKRSLRGSSKWE